MKIVIFYSNFFHLIQSVLRPVFVCIKIIVTCMIYEYIMHKSSEFLKKIYFNRLLMYILLPMFIKSELIFVLYV